MGLNSKHLVGAILLFILLDLSILLINYWITYQLSKDAIAINLAGRQRMLSQRITKSLLTLDFQTAVAQRQTTKEELRASRMLAKYKSGQALASRFIPITPPGSRNSFGGQTKLCTRLKTRGKISMFVCPLTQPGPYTSPKTYGIELAEIIF